MQVIIGKKNFYLNSLCTENESPSQDLEENLVHDVHHLAIAAADAESVNEVSWREVPGSGWSLHFNSGLRIPYSLRKKRIVQSK